MCDYREVKMHIQMYSLKIMAYLLPDPAYLTAKELKDPRPAPAR